MVLPALVHCTTIMANYCTTRTSALQGYHGQLLQTNYHKMNQNKQTWTRKKQHIALVSFGLCVACTALIHSSFKQQHFVKCNCSFEAVFFLCNVYSISSYHNVNRRTYCILQIRPQKKNWLKISSSNVILTLGTKDGTTATWRISCSSITFTL